MIFGVSSPQFRPFASYKSVTTVISPCMDIYIPFMDIYIPFMDIYIYPIYGYSYYTSFISVGKNTSHMLHGAGMFTNICPNKITKFCR